MIGCFKKILSLIWQNMVNNTDDARPYLSLLGYILIITFTGFYFFNLSVVTASVEENLSLRLIISILGLGLVINKYWPRSLVRFIPAFFYLTLFLSFPFFFSYMLFKSPDSNIWQINELTGLVILAMFVDWRSFAVLTIFGIWTAFICAANEQLFLYSHLVGIFGSYSSPIICLLFLAQKRKNFQKERDKHHGSIAKLNESLELKVQDRTNDLQKALAIKEEFLNNMSHEVRTPIHGFMAISEGLVDNWDNIEEEKKYKYAREIASNAKRLGSLVTNILDLSKFNAGKMLLDYRDVDMNALIGEIIYECQCLYLNNRNINIIFVPEEKMVVRVDHERIAQVIRNLLFNAIKFTPDTGIIKVTVDKKDKNTHIAIEDNGMGIPESELLTIFDSFTQSSRTKTGAGGTGLGLAIVKKIIEAHSGKIWAENNDDVGAIFHIYL